MQTKTIKKNIESKLTEWLNSIGDKELSKELKDNILVSGGSITSLFFNEKVNDYDIYIMDRDILVKLIHYYTEPYKITVLKGWEKEKLLEDSLRKNTNENIYAITVENLKENQIKLFLDNRSGQRVNENKIIDSSNATSTKTEKYFPKFFSPNAISLSDDIQIVVRFHGNAEEIHKTFDFIHATNYFTFKDGLVTNKEALESILTKQLKYQGSLYPLTTIIRVKKFLKRGWNISAGELLKIMFQISELDLKNPNVLEEQLVGVDVAYFGTLIEILRGVDPEKINSQYLNAIIDKVFNETEENENI